MIRHQLPTGCVWPLRDNEGTLAAVRVRCKLWVHLGTLRVIIATIERPDAIHQSPHKGASSSQSTTLQNTILPRIGLPARVQSTVAQAVCGSATGQQNAAAECSPLPFLLNLRRVSKLSPTPQEPSLEACHCGTWSFESGTLRRGGEAGLDNTSTRVQPFGCAMLCTGCAA